MAKLSVSIPDDIADDLRTFASGNVSAFVASAIRHELDRRRLFGFLEELEAELGPADEEEVARFTAALQRTAEPPRAPRRASTRQRSAG